MRSIGGLSISELNALELELVFLLGFQLTATPALYALYEDELWRNAALVGGDERLLSVVAVAPAPFVGKNEPTEEAVVAVVAAAVATVAAFDESRQARKRQRRSAAAAATAQTAVAPPAPWPLAVAPPSVPPPPPPPPMRAPHQRMEDGSTAASPRCLQPLLQRAGCDTRLLVQ